MCARSRFHAEEPTVPHLILAFLMLVYYDNCPVGHYKRHSRNSRRVSVWSERPWNPWRSTQPRPPMRGSPERRSSRNPGPTTTQLHGAVPRLLHKPKPETPHARSLHALVLRDRCARSLANVWESWPLQQRWICQCYHLAAEPSI